MSTTFPNRELRRRVTDRKKDSHSGSLIIAPVSRSAPIFPLFVGERPLVATVRTHHQEETVHGHVRGIGTYVPELRLFSRIL